MSKLQKQQRIKALKSYQNWRRDGEGPQPNPAEIGKHLDWAISVCEAAQNLVEVKGRHNTEQAFKKLKELFSQEGVDA